MDNRNITFKTKDGIWRASWEGKPLKISPNGPKYNIMHDNQVLRTAADMYEMLTFILKLTNRRPLFESDRVYTAPNEIVT
jgi:hypothetical protein